MAKIYLEKLQDMLGPVGARLPAGVELEIKHFFSGAACYAGGSICITLTPVGLAMKLSEADRAAARKAGGRALRYFPNGPIKKDYVVLPGKIRGNTRSLRAWARKSIRYALAAAGSGSASGSVSGSAAGKSRGGARSASGSKSSGRRASSV